MRRALIIASFMVFGVAHAGPIDTLFGLWESPDGNARQQFVEEFPGLIATKMWFKAGEDWKVVGQGVLYSRPGPHGWVGATRTANMGGIELFESVVTPMENGKFSVKNKSYDAKGAVTETVEDWTVKIGGIFDYKIFKVTGDGGRTPWMEGRWKKTPVQKP